MIVGQTELLPELIIIVCRAPESGCADLLRHKVLGPAEIRPANVGLIEYSASQIRSLELRLAQIRLLKIRPLERCLSQIHPTQMRVLHVSVGEVSAVHETSTRRLV